MSNYPPVNVYAETAILWAVLSDDINEATRLIQNMTMRDDQGCLRT